MLPMGSSDGKHFRLNLSNKNKMPAELRQRTAAQQASLFVRAALQDTRIDLHSLHARSLI